MNVFIAAVRMCFASDLYFSVLLRGSSDVCVCVCVCVATCLGFAEADSHSAH